MADQVALTELDVIARYSLAVATEFVDREELVSVLQADLAWLQEGRPRPRPRPAGRR
ncbi:MAG: hypothetical protein ACYCO3_11270 [Mycobacteriales bacterium]